ncbi:hypothetical protein [Saccharopolyspora sp. NPDC050642]
MNDVNREVIREFRANRGEVGGAFEGVQFADFQERTARLIPVVALEPGA